MFLRVNLHASVHVPVTFRRAVRTCTWVCGCLHTMCNLYVCTCACACMWCACADCARSCMCEVVCACSVCVCVHMHGVCLRVHVRVHILMICTVLCDIIILCVAGLVN